MFLSFSDPKVFVVLKAVHIHWSQITKICIWFTSWFSYALSPSKSLKYKTQSTIKGDHNWLKAATAAATTTTEYSIGIMITDIRYRFHFYSVLGLRHTRTIRTHTFSTVQPFIRWEKYGYSYQILLSSRAHMRIMVRHMYRIKYLIFNISHSINRMDLHSPNYTDSKFNRKSNGCNNQQWQQEQ